ncbi:MAG: hypothetical protein H8D26_01480 [Methanomicrobia archaeon]|nr:hypothetical protein [Methanomicrobia archaeon]
MTKKERLNRITESIIYDCKVGLLINFNPNAAKDFPDSLCPLRAPR